MSNYNCHFCHAQLQIISYVAKCPTCNTEFAMINNQLNQWKCYGITYRLKPHPKYYSVVMHLDTNTTTIWTNLATINKYTGHVELDFINLPGAYPNIHPNDIVNFTDRLINLKVFL